MSKSNEQNRSLLLHIRSGDYFGTLATVLDLLCQDAEKNGFNKHHASTLRNSRDDLMELQKGYSIKDLRS